MAMVKGMGTLMAMQVEMGTRMARVPLGTATVMGTARAMAMLQMNNGYRQCVATNEQGGGGVRPNKKKTNANQRQCPPQ